MSLTFETVSKALAAAEKALYSLKGAQYILRVDPLTFAERDELNELVTTAENQLKESLKHLEPG